MGLNPCKGKRLSSSPKCPEHIWDPQSILCNRNQGLFAWSKVAGSWCRQLTSNQWLRLGISEASSPFLTFLHGVNRDNFTSYKGIKNDLTKL